MISLFDVQKLRNEELKELFSVRKVNDEKLRELLNIMENPLIIGKNYELAKINSITLNNIQYS